MTRLQMTTMKLAMSGLILLAMLLLAACGVAQTPTPTDEPMAISTPTPDVRPNASGATSTPISPVTPTPTDSPEDSAAPAADSTVVEVEMGALSFTFDRSQIPLGQEFTFHAHNSGLQAHELVLVKVNTDTEALLAVMQMGAVQLDAIPEGVELIGSTGPIAPGQDGSLKVGALEPGRYAITSLLPDEFDPDHILQVFKGMVAEFRLEAAS